MVIWSAAGWSCGWAGLGRCRRCFVRIDYIASRGLRAGSLRGKVGGGNVLVELHKKSCPIYLDH